MSRWLLSFMLLFSTSLWANDYGRFGMEAYQAGDLVLAERFLLKALALEHEELSLQEQENDQWHQQARVVYERTIPWRETLAHVYWEMGRDHELLDYAEQYLQQPQQQYWWCRVLERRGHTKEAENCWIEAGYESRVKRTIRSRVMLDVLAPDGTAFGNRPPPPLH